MTGYINLLPKPEQKEVSLERLGVRVLNLFVWVLVSLAILILLFVAARFYLQTELNSTLAQVEMKKEVATKGENLDIRRQLQEFNSHLGNLVKLEESQGHWAEAMIQFARLVPAEVAIDSFVADRQSGKIRIAGVGKTRDAVLKLRDNLLESEYFVNVNFPLANLVRPVDVDFYYTFYIKPEALTR